MKNRAEEVFEWYCKGRGISCCPIQEEKRKTPDYFIEVSGVSILVEVKGLRPNEKEKESERELERTGTGLVIGAEVGKRLREPLDKADKQIREYKEVSGWEGPAVIVLFAGEELSLRGHVAPENIRAAMCGIPFQRVGVESGYVYEEGRSPQKRELTEFRGNHVSGVVVMYYGDFRQDLPVPPGYPDKRCSVYLAFFRNVYAMPSANLLSEIVRAFCQGIDEYPRSRVP